MLCVLKSLKNYTEASSRRTTSSKPEPANETNSYLTKIARSVVSAHTNMVSVVSVILSQSHEVAHQAPKIPPPV
jgi:hypothetical protein